MWDSRRLLPYPIAKEWELHRELAKFDLGVSWMWVGIRGSHIVGRLVYFYICTCIKDLKLLPTLHGEVLCACIHKILLANEDLILHIAKSISYLSLSHSPTPPPHVVCGVKRRGFGHGPWFGVRALLCGLLIGVYWDFIKCSLMAALRGDNCMLSAHRP